MSDQSSTSSDSQEETLRTAYVTVQALSRLRSFSGNLFTPAGFGRVRQESGPASIPEASATTTVSSPTSTGSPTPSATTTVSSPTSTGSPTPSGKFLRTVLILTSNCLYYEAQQWKREVLLEDLIGIVIPTKPPSNNPSACEMQVHYYPVKYSRSGTRQGRKRLMMSVQFDSEATLDDNRKKAEEWKLAIRLGSQRVVRREFYTTEDQSLNSTDSEELVERRLLVLVNPVGGKGRGVTEFEKHARPMFDLAEIKYEVKITEEQNYARELIKTSDLSKWDGIVISSGDGLLYEVINGIMEREDWEKAILTPVGMLPTGSGNALCASTLYESGEDFGMVNAAFQIIRGGVIPLDLATVQTEGGLKCYMSLLSAWGMIADIDIQSEKYRKIGESRFFLGALACIVKKKTYSGKLSYLPFEEDDQPAQSTTNDGSEKDTHKNTSTEKLQDNLNGSKIPGETAAVPSSSDNLNGSKVDVPGETAAVPLSSDDIANESPADAEEIAAMSATIAKGIESAEKIMTKSPHGPKVDLLPPFSTPLPLNWKTVDRDFLTMTVLMIPHMSSTAFGDPGLSIGMKKMSILFVHSQTSRKDMFSMLLNIDNGTHIDMEDCNMIYAKAFRLEPATPSGLLTVDGEVIPYGPVQAQIHPGLARVMCRKRRNKETVD